MAHFKTKIQTREIVLGDHHQRPGKPPSLRPHPLNDVLRVGTGAFPYSHCIFNEALFFN